MLVYVFVCFFTTFLCSQTSLQTHHGLLYTWRQGTAVLILMWGHVSGDPAYASLNFTNCSPPTPEKNIWPLICQMCSFVHTQSRDGTTQWYLQYSHYKTNFKKLDVKPEQCLLQTTFCRFSLQAMLSFNYDMDEGRTSLADLLQS